jgi:hypothetical protein
VDLRVGIVGLKVEIAGNILCSYEKELIDGVLVPGVCDRFLSENITVCCRFGFL